MPRSERNDQLAMKEHRRILRHDQSTACLTRECIHGLLDLAWVARVDRTQFHAHMWRHCLDRAELADSGRYVRIPHDGHPRHGRCDLLEKFQPLATDAVLKRGKASGIAARPPQTRDQPSTDRIGATCKYDGHCSSSLL